MLSIVFTARSQQLLRQQSQARREMEQEESSLSDTRRGLTEAAKTQSVPVKTGSQQEDDL